MILYVRKYFSNYNTQLRFTFVYGISVADIRIVSIVSLLRSPDVIYIFLIFRIACLRQCIQTCDVSLFVLKCF
jgi:hypothetical protein